jgi:hypothetical protein
LAAFGGILYTTTGTTLSAYDGARYAGANAETEPHNRVVAFAPA